jgi:D-beta-D-heptose 7-phosphate kinase/D-beta-D-heptose 1-phosphate adenosyltransferase
MLDRYVAGRAVGISPEASVPIVQVEKEWVSAGGAANVAANLVALGARCDLVGCVGDDDAGRELQDLLEELGVDTAGLVQSRGRRTTVKTRILVGHQQIVRMDRERSEDVDSNIAQRLRDKTHAGLLGCAAIVLEDYDKGVLVPVVIQEALDGAKRQGIPVIVDPKRRRFFAYRSATVFKPNAKELEDALGEPVRPEDGAWMERVRSRLDCAHLLLTLGRDGMALCSARRGTTLFPTTDQAVFDVSGAGDTVTAVVSLAAALGAPMSEAAALANLAAALQVSKPGVATVTKVELQERASSFLASKAVGQNVIT